MRGLLASALINGQNYSLDRCTGSPGRVRNNNNTNPHHRKTGGNEDGVEGWHKNQRDRQQG